MNPDYRPRRNYSPQEMRIQQEMMQELKRQTGKVLIQQKLIEIDSFRNAKREILKGDSSSIVKGYLVNDIESRIEMLKMEIGEMVGGY